MSCPLQFIHPELTCPLSFFVNTPHSRKNAFSPTSCPSWSETRIHPSQIRPSRTNSQELPFSVAAGNDSVVFSWSVFGNELHASTKSSERIPNHHAMRAAVLRRCCGFKCRRNRKLRHLPTMETQRSLRSVPHWSWPSTKVLRSTDWSVHLLQSHGMCMANHIRSTKHNNLLGRSDNPTLRRHSGANKPALPNAGRTTRNENHSAHLSRWNEHNNHRTLQDVGIGRHPVCKVGCNDTVRSGHQSQSDKRANSVSVPRRLCSAHLVVILQRDC